MRGIPELRVLPVLGGVGLGGRGCLIVFEGAGFGANFFGCRVGVGFRVGWRAWKGFGKQGFVFRDT